MCEDYILPKGVSVAKNILVETDSSQLCKTFDTNYRSKKIIINGPMKYTCNLSTRSV